MADHSQNHRRYHSRKPPKSSTSTTREQERTDARAPAVSRAAGAVPALWSHPSRRRTLGGCNHGGAAVAARSWCARLLLLVGVAVLLLAGMTGCKSGRWALNRATSPASRELPPLDPDNDPDALSYADLVDREGEVPRPARCYRVGALLKFLGNEYWQLVAEGLHEGGAELGVVVDVRAASTARDPGGQEQILLEMMEQSYDAFIVAPQTDENLRATVAAIRSRGLPVLVVEEIIAGAEHWVGPNQQAIGGLAAEYLAAQLGPQAAVAVVEGPPQAYTARQRTLGFHLTAADARLNVVASVPCYWDAQRALNATAQIIADHPEVRGFYANNDTMAMGALEAIAAAGRADDVLVVGTDGIGLAYDAILDGRLAATVDHYPYTTGEIAIELVVRLLEGQSIPRVVYTPHQLITREMLSP